MRYNKEFRDYFSKVPIFTFNDAARFLRKMHATNAYVKLFVHNQMKRHGLLRISKGHYTYLDNEAAIGFAFSPSYYGLEHSLTMHRLWTQVSIPVIVTATKAVPGIRESMGKRILVRRISKNMFFGIEHIIYNSMFVPVSDIEKTLVDFIYFRVSLSTEDTSRILQMCDVGKLRRYAKRCGKRVKDRLETLLVEKKRNQAIR